MRAESRKIRRTAVVGAILLGLTVAHFTTSPHRHDVHSLLFKATYLPLILAGLWFGVRGAVIALGLTSGAYLVHLFTQLHGFTLGIGLADIALYHVVTLTTAFLSRRRVQALARAEDHARKAQENARALLRAEETIRRGERLSALGELAAGMAHEIRNPLGGIRGAGEVLRKPDASAEAREEFGGLLEDEIVRLDQVVGNFLDFARQPAARVAAVEPSQVVDAVLLLVEPTARERGVTLESSVPRELTVRADADLLRQILLNLVLNAVQVQDGPGSVSVSCQGDGDCVVLDVSDTGPGVGDDLRSTLFDPYVTRRPGGSGLGLAVAARLAASMGGAVSLLRTSPAGSVFRVELPGHSDGVAPERATPSE